VPFWRKTKDRKTLERKSVGREETLGTNLDLKEKKNKVGPRSKKGRNWE